MSNLCVESESDLTFPGGGDAGRARLLPMGSNRGGVNATCTSYSRLPLPYSTDNSMTKAKEHSKEMCYLSPKTFDQQAHLSYPALYQHADPQADPISFPHLPHMQVMEKTWKDTPENMQIKETGNLRALFVRSLLYHHYH